MPYAIGTSATTMATLTTLGLKDPKSGFRSDAERLALGNGKYRGAGLPMATWHWGYLTQSQRDVLRAYCSGASATVYIETRKTESSDSYDQYQAVMVWPEEEERDNFYRLDITFEFQELVEI